MFYAAAGIRNYISKHGKRPNEAARTQIINRALNAEKAKAIWKDRYKKKGSLNPSTKKDLELKSSTDEIVVDVPKLSDIGEKPKIDYKKPIDEFETVIKNAVATGIISNKTAAYKKIKNVGTAAKKFKELGINMDTRYITLYPRKYGSSILIRITTKYGLQCVSLSSKDFSNEVEMIMEADKIRRQILKTGKLTTAKEDESSHEDVVLDEQQTKSKGIKTSIFSKIRMWIFG
jgi:hypothetical protein